jgi:hypothetical protein
MGAGRAEPAVLPSGRRGGWDGGRAGGWRGWVGLDPGVGGNSRPNWAQGGEYGRPRQDGGPKLSGSQGQFGPPMRAIRWDQRRKMTPEDEIQYGVGYNFHSSHRFVTIKDPKDS